MLTLTNVAGVAGDAVMNTGKLSVSENTVMCVHVDGSMDGRDEQALRICYIMVISRDAV